MKYFVITLFVLITISCSNKKEKIFFDLDKLVLKTDSLLAQLQKKHSEVSEYLYFISEDSFKRDSLKIALNLTDSLGFYQFIEKNQIELTEIVLQTQHEVYFAKDQINSVRIEYANRNISDKEYRNEVSILKELVDFLAERVDSNLVFIEENYDFGQIKKDSILNEK